MRFCFIADYRSPIARNWIGYFVRAGHEVHVISTYSTGLDREGLASYREAPRIVALAQRRSSMRKYFGTAQTAGDEAPSRAYQLVGTTTRKLGYVGQEMINAVMPVEALWHRGAVRDAIREIQPDLVHAMRIPPEGFIALEALRGSDLPLVTSVWGNDFTLWASRFKLLERWTRRTLQRTTALHTDCHRDLRLARELGYPADQHSLVVPASGGVQREMFQPAPVSDERRRHWKLPPGRPVVFNPRSFRPDYVRNDSFFAAIPLVLQERPDALFVGVGMAGNPEAERWRRRLADPGSFVLLPAVKRPDMAELFRIATITVSPSTHDGTPNTLLEGMACGAFPIVGDVESVREWVEDGVNGMVCDAGSGRAIASAILAALGDPDRLARARARNQQIIDERGTYDNNMQRAAEMYETMLAATRSLHAMAV